MTEFLLVVLIVIGLVIVYVLIHCAKSLQDNRNITRQTLEVLERELVRQSLVIEAGVAARKIEGNAAFRLEHYRFGQNRPAKFRFAADLRSQSVAGFGIWVFRDGAWHLEEDLCQKGFEPGSPPEIPGRFSGDRIRKEGVSKN